MKGSSQPQLLSTRNKSFCVTSSAAFGIRRCNTCSTFDFEISRSIHSNFGNEVKQEEDETTTQLPGYDLFSKGLDLQNGMKDFLKGYPDPEKMGGPIERNPEEGNRLIMEAAKLGLKGAEYATALNYLPGGFYHTNEEESMKEVHKWIELAALNGHAEAQVTYGQKLWIEGLDGSHPIDKEKGLFWLRKALAHGVTDGNPDPMGNALSQKSFRCTLDSATNTARDLFLYKASPLIADEDSDYEELIHICADCGVGAALQHVQFGSRESGVMKD